jgi:hypothetical protein
MSVSRAPTGEIERCGGGEQVGDRRYVDDAPIVCSSNRWHDDAATVEYACEMSIERSHANLGDVATLGDYLAGFSVSITWDRPFTTLTMKLSRSKSPLSS